MRTVAVILNYNDADETIEAVRRVKDFEIFSAVIVVDNASTDDSADRLEAFLGGLNGRYAKNKDTEAARFILLISPKNGGYGYGNDLGVRYAEADLGAELALIANPDAIFSEELIEDMKALLLHEGMGAVGAVIKEAGKTDSGVKLSELRASAWPLRCFCGELINSAPLLRRIFRSLINYGGRELNEAKELERPASHKEKRLRYMLSDCVHGSLLMIDIASFLSAGGYDENIFLYCEENVLGSRLREKGCKTGLLISGGYTHKGASATSRSLGMTKRQKERQRSELYYYKNYLGAGVVALFFARLLQSLVLFETFIYEKLGK